MKIFKTIFGFLRQRWFVSLVGLIAVILIIWYVAPFVEFADFAPFEPEFNRLVTIAVLVLLWLIRQGWKLFQARRNNQQMLKSIGDSEAPALSPVEQASVDEVDTLRERMQEAIAVLKKTRVGQRWNRQYLYQLPWYVLIGPPGSGKTTLLINSELKFPLAERFGNEAIRGVGGTRNCDWWFTDEAVLLDTAGRYTTQDSQAEVDRNAWLGFLDLLKKHRRRRPINGIVVAVSITDIVTLDETQRNARASEIRERINELTTELGIRFPIYFLFTKTDLLSGFMEFFADLNTEERAQVWGMTFQLAEQPEPLTDDQFNNEFNGILDRLMRNVIQKIESERNIQRREQIYLFPQQFAALSERINHFVQAVFQASRYQEAVMLRGVYFTSATQEGTPIDRILASIGKQFAVEQNKLTGTSGKGKSFFINRLLQQVIFAEKGLAGTNLKLEKKRVWLQRGAVIALAAVSAIALLGWMGSYFKNRSNISAVTEQTAQLQTLINDFNTESDDLLSTLVVLDPARELSKTGRSLPLTAHLGLYQGRKLDLAGQRNYERLLKTTLLPRLMRRLETQIRTYGNDIDYLYEALKVYVMLENRKYFDAAAFRTWITLDWENQLPLETTNQQRQALQNHLDSLISRPPTPLPRPLDASLIAEARQVLASAPLAGRVYGRLKLELAQADIKDFTISEAAGRNAPLVFALKSSNLLNQGIDGLYTYNGYHDYFQKAKNDVSNNLAKESWILGEQHRIDHSSENLDELRQAVEELYLEDFLKHWKVLLSDLRIVPVTSLQEAVQVLSTLSSEQSPLKLLLEAVARETDLSNRSVQADKLDKAKDKLDSAKAKLSKIINKGKIPVPKLPTRQFSSLYISDQFKELHQLVINVEGQPSLLDGLMQQIDDLRIYLSPLVGTTGEEMVLEQRKAIEKKLLQIKSDVDRQPFPVNILLADAVNSVNDIVGGGVCQHLNALWKNEMLGFCNQAINQRYPFLQHSQSSTTQEDFAQFFAPGGRMDTFFSTYLAASVDKTGNSWEWISNDNAPVCASTGTLKQFRNAKIIKDTFFRFGSQLPSVGFSLKPISMSDEITQFTLIIDGQKLSYAHGPPQVVPLKWPGPDNSGQVQLQVSPALAGRSSGLSLEGPWAVFRLFDQANLRAAGKERYIVKFNIDGRDATFELRANSAFNPFSLPELRNFRCPQSL